MDNITPEEKSIVKEMFSPTVVLFLIPAYIYLCSFLFEKGMCDFYGIPQDLIKPDLTTNLIFFFSLVSIIVVIYLVPHFLAAIFLVKIDKNPALSPFLRSNTIVIISFISGIYFLTMPINWWKTFLLFLLASIIANLMALMQYIYLKEQLKSRDYNDIATSWNDQVMPKFPLFDIPDVLNFNVLLKVTKVDKILLLLLLGVAFLSYRAGQSTAYRKKSYDLSTNKKEFVLLKTYGDNMILKNVNLKNRRLGDSIILVKIGDSNYQIFVSENIGQLLYKP